MDSSPHITHISWGEIETESDSFKDAKLFPGGAREWDWNETGTEHNPGIQPADVEELLEHDIDIMILSTGQEEKLHVMRETLNALKETGVSVHVLPTPEAVEMYNKLAEEGKAVGALIHSTC